MRFEAPWSTAVKLVTAGTVVLLVVVVTVLGGRLPAGSGFWPGAVVWGAPLLILLGGLLFTVRGYRLEPTRLLVDRLLWPTAIELEGLEEAWHDPSAMRRSVRLFGNGGLFAIAGLFSNKRLGRYRAFATDPQRAVVLVFAERKVVVTPDRPDEFVRQLGVLRPRSAGETAA